MSEWPKAPCCTGRPDEDCLCPTNERALRGWMDGHLSMPMTNEQREYCLQEIASVEGYDASEYRDDTDADLARATIGAWIDYCRDKGLL